MASRCMLLAQVIAHNSIAFFRDPIGVPTYGTPEDEQELKAVSIDI